MSFLEQASSAQELLTCVAPTSCIRPTASPVVGTSLPGLSDKGGRRWHVPGGYRCPPGQARYPPASIIPSIDRSMQYVVVHDEQATYTWLARVLSLAVSFDVLQAEAQVHA